MQPGPEAKYSQDRGTESASTSGGIATSKNVLETKSKNIFRKIRIQKLFKKKLLGQRPSGEMHVARAILANNMASLFASKRMNYVLLRVGILTYSLRRLQLRDSGGFSPHFPHLNLKGPEQIHDMSIRPKLREFGLK